MSALAAIYRYELIIVYHKGHAVFTAFFTPTAFIEADTFIGINTDLAISVYTFGIAAPFAAEAAALHEKFCSDTGTIVYCKWLYVEYCSGQY